MEIERRMLYSLGIGEEGIGLVKKIEEIRELDKNISSIEFRKTESRWEKISVQVQLKKGFENFGEFKQYVERMGLKGNLSIEASYKVRNYLIFNDGVVGEFLEKNNF
jgi:hypothetical protein